MAPYSAAIVTQTVSTEISAGIRIERAVAARAIGDPSRIVEARFYILLLISIIDDRRSEGEAKDGAYNQASRRVIVAVIVSVTAQPILPQRPFVAIPIGRGVAPVIPTLVAVVTRTEFMARRRISAIFPIRVRRRRLIASLLSGRRR